MDQLKKAKFYVYWQQYGGCDYTIGCGFYLKALSAQTLEEARKEVADAIEDNDSDNSLAFATIIEAKHVEEFDLDARREELREEQERQEKADTEQQERALLAKLKRKYGG